MKSLLFGAGLAALLTGSALAADDPVKAGIDAWTRGDYATAVADWRGPAEAGDADAQFNLAQAYKLGHGVPVDLVQAEHWYGKAAMQGHPQAADNYGLALFQNGRKAEAVPWLTRSAAKGEPRAQFVLGAMYFNGEAVPKDWPRAYALTTLASQAGLSQASQALAQMESYITPDDRQQGQELVKHMTADIGAAKAPPPSAPPASTIVASTPPVTTVAPPPPASPTPTPETPVPRETVREGGWRIQIGAFGDPGNAHKLWEQTGARFPGRRPAYVKAGALTRLLVGPYGSKAEAERACAATKPCMPVAP